MGVGKLRNVSVVQFPNTPCGLAGPNGNLDLSILNAVHDSQQHPLLIASGTLFGIQIIKALLTLNCKIKFKKWWTKFSLLEF